MNRLKIKHRLVSSVLWQENSYWLVNILQPRRDANVVFLVFSIDVIVWVHTEIVSVITIPFQGAATQLH